MISPATLFGAFRLVTAAVLFGVASISLASMVGEPVFVTVSKPFDGPAVDGNTISWSDDGWYQVQDSLTYESLCQGGTSCTVDPGTYIVINHTTGRRYSDIVVGGTSGTESLVVEGQTIRWPDDGWYQVQNAETYESFCEGERFCTVDPGTYIVINHTTGHRFEDVVVESADGSGSNRSVTVDGDTIRWPDDGWYQVQSAETYESLCEGGLSCTVAPGTYTVINLTTGERFPGIEVAGEGSGGVTVDGNTIRWPDDGWYQVQNAETYESLCEGGSSCAVEPGTYVVINHTKQMRFERVVVESGDSTGFFTPIGVDSYLPKVFDLIRATQLQEAYSAIALRRVLNSQTNDAPGFKFVSRLPSGGLPDIYLYDCEGGGTATTTKIVSTISPSTEVVAEECSVEGYEYNGIFRQDSSRGYGSISFGSGLIVTTSSGQTISWSGSNLSDFLEGAGPNRSQSWNISRFEEGPLRLLVLQDFAHSVSYSTPADIPQSRERKFSVNGLAEVDWAPAATLQFTTSEVFSNYGVNSTYERGKLTVSSSDGTSITVSADNGDSRSFQLDVDSIDSMTSLTIDWADLYKLPCLDSSTDLASCDSAE